MTVFEFVLRLLGILVPKAHEKRKEDERQREEPLIDMDKELEEARRDAQRHDPWN